MAVIANKRSIMTLYSGGLDLYSHQVRIVLAEKGVAVDIIDVKPESKPEDLADLNPYNTVPTLVDRDLVLYNAQIIMEYLDERFPHPPLLPIYPVQRAKCRLMIYRIERDWFSQYHVLKNPNATDKQLSEARKNLQDSLTGVAPIFSEMDYFLNEEYTIVDCAVAPLLWRLPLLDIEIPKQAKPLHGYMERLFDRETFQASLTEVEKEIRDTVK